MTSTLYRVRWERVAGEKEEGEGMEGRRIKESHFEKGEAGDGDLQSSLKCG